MATAKIKPTEPANAHFSSILKFDGVDDYIVLPEMNIDYSRGLTIEAWVRFHSFKSFSRIIDFGNGPAKSNILLANSITTNNLLFDIYQDGDNHTYFQVEELLELGKWIHLAATVDGFGQTRVYANGKLVKSGYSYPPASINRTSNYIAKSNWSSDGYFHGEITEIRLWNCDRTEAEIQKNLYFRLTGKEQNLVGYWPLNEGIGNQVVKDKSPSSNHGTIHGGANWQQQIPIKPIELGLPEQLFPYSQEPIFLRPLDEQKLPVRSVLILDGQNDYIEIPYTEILNPNQFTLSVWVKAQGGQNTFRSIITSRDDHPQRGYILYISDDNKWHFWIGGGGAGWIVLVGTDIVLNTWTHLTATCDGSNFQLYINGELVATKAGNYHLNTARPWRIGAGTTEGNPSFFFPGQIAEIHLWNRVLSQAEVQKELHCYLFGNEPGLVGYWCLNEGSGYLVKDWSSFVNHGKIQGNTNWQQQALISSTDPRDQDVLDLDSQDDHIDRENDNSSQLSISGVSFSFGFSTGMFGFSNSYFRFRRIK